MAYLRGELSRSERAGHRLICVNDGVPVETTELLLAACASRDVEFIEVYAPLFDYDPRAQLEAGDSLFRPATSAAAIRVEQFLYSDGVATLYEPGDSMFFHGSPSSLIVQRAGLTIPRTVFCSASDRQLLRTYVAQLGGFPIVLKAPGYSGGIGVVRLDSFPSLFSVVDLLLARNVLPQLCTYIADATHWRITVVGDKVVSAYKNICEVDDFRTHASSDRNDYTRDVPQLLSTLATQAVKALRVEFAGVDVLEHPTGRAYFLEANFPAYFANADRIGGHDVAGALVEHLMRKACSTEGRALHRARHPTQTTNQSV